MINKDARVLIEEIKRIRPKGLSVWEKDFLSRIDRTTADKTVPLTFKQSTKLQEIYRKSSEEVV